MIVTAAILAFLGFVAIYAVGIVCVLISEGFKAVVKARGKEEE